MSGRLPALLLLLLALGAAGCGNICDRMCVGQADLVDRCLDTWGTTWEELSYTDRGEFLDRCGVVWGDGLDDASGDDKVTLRQECASRLQMADSDTDCEAVFD